MLNKQFYLYLLTNFSNKVVYIGVTNDLKRRVFEHKNGLVDGFTRNYHVHKLVYYEVSQDIEGVILREKQLKSGPRKRKDELIKKFNPDWKDLYDQL